jgi:two-component system cell cycle response regulator
LASILVVDPSHAQRGALRQQIEPRGHVVHEAATAAEARQVAAAEELDAVILTWELPDEPAPFTLRLWSMHERLRWVPVIVVTSHERPEMIEEALRLGAADFIRKPVQEVELGARLKAALRSRDLQLELVRLARHDALTGLHNRRYFMERLAAEHSRAKRYGKHATLAILDVDRFKGVNDAYGHDVGDAVLRKLADVLRAGIRTVDVAARYGGEEFALLLPETGPAGAFTCLDRLRLAAERAPWTALGLRAPVTFSAGVAVLLADEPTPDASLKMADEALYEAKERGRNRVVVAAAPHLSLP